MGSAAEKLAEVVGDRAHVGSGGDPGAETGAVGLDRENRKFFDFDVPGLQNNFFMFARQLVGRHAFNLLGREGRRDLFDPSAEVGGLGFELFPAQIYGFGLAGGLAFGVVGVGGESEADDAFVGFFRRDVELREAREAADDKWENSGSHGIERAEMSDGA